MNILIISSNYPNKYSNNSFIFVKDQANALVRFGHSVSVVSIVGVSLKKFFKNSDKVLAVKRDKCQTINELILTYPAIPKCFLMNEIIKFILVTLIYFLKLRNFHLDIIHVHGFVGTTAAIFIKKLLKVPLFVTEHHTVFVRHISKLKQKVAANLFKSADVRIAVSESFQALLSDKFKLKFVYLPNIVDDLFFEHVRPNYITPKRFLCVANYEHRKNQAMLLEAFAKVKAKNPDISLVFAGTDGPELETLKKIMHKFNVKGVDVYVGIERSQIIRLFSEADCLILTSNYETFGVVLIEALASGIPVITTRSEGPLSIIKDKKLGLICDCNKLAVEEAITDILSCEYDTYNLKKYAEKNFSGRSVMRKLTVLYKEKSQHE